MPSHKSRLVDITGNTIDSAFGGVLPCKDVAAVSQHRLLRVVFCYKQFVTIKLVGEIVVVKALVGIYERFLMIFSL